MGDSNPILLSCVVPLFNHVEFSRAMLESLRASLPADLHYEIILVDDDSIDRTRDWLRSLDMDPRLRIILNERNLGFAASCNRGAREARGDVLALLNNDLVLEPGWLEPMLALLKRKGDRAGIVGNLQYRVDNGTLDHAGIRLNGRAKLEHIREKPEGDECRVFAVTGACCLTRRRDFLALDGFDEGYVNGAEDVDLCLKFARHGQEAWVALDSRVKHHVSAARGPTSLGDEKNSRRLFTRWQAALENELTRRIEAEQVTKPGQAILLARSALWREEARWRQLLDAHPTPRVQALASGFQVSAPGSPVYLRKSALIRMPAGFPVRNLFISGYLEPAIDDVPASKAAMGLRVSLNGIQTLIFFPLPVGNFNLEVPDPASLPGRATELRIELLGAPWSRLLHGFATMLGLLPLPSAWKIRVLARSKDRMQKRLRFARIVADDQAVPLTPLT